MNDELKTKSAAPIRIVIIETWRCFFCGCTEARACQTEFGPCEWILEPTEGRCGVCSNPACAEAFEEKILKPNLEAR